MLSKMHRKMTVITLTHAQLSAWGVIMTAALALGLLGTPASAADGQPDDASAPLTLWAEHLPNDFQAITARLGIQIVGIEHLEALGAHLVSVVPADGQSPDSAFQALNGQFPSFRFEQLNGNANDFELIEY